MPGFAIRYPFFVIMLCLIIAVVGLTTVARMPVDLFPNINIPVVVVATFYSGMPPEQIEANITNPFERFFTLGSGIDHIESRSLTGVSLIKIYFQPGTNPDAAVSGISNLAMAQLRRLPPGTLPPVVLKFDASSLPVCLITLKGQGLNETELHDLGQFTVRNQIANVPGASVPQPFGGKYRQIQVYVDPVKLQAHQLSLMDVVRTVNDANTILPAGDVRIGPKDYTIYTNSQLPTTEEINRLPLKSEGNAELMVMRSIFSAIFMNRWLVMCKKGRAWGFGWVHSRFGFRTGPKTARPTSLESCTAPEKVYCLTNFPKSYTGNRSRPFVLVATGWDLRF